MSKVSFTGDDLCLSNAKSDQTKDTLQWKLGSSVCGAMRCVESEIGRRKKDQLPSTHETRKEEERRACSSTSSVTIQ